MHRLVDAIQIGIHNICLYKETDRKNTGCNLKATELLDCALIGVCAVIRYNTVCVELMSEYLGKIQYQRKTGKDKKGATWLCGTIKHGSGRSDIIFTLNIQTL